MSGSRNSRAAKILTASHGSAALEEDGGGGAGTVCTRNTDLASCRPWASDWAGDDLIRHSSHPLGVRAMPVGCSTRQVGSPTAADQLPNPIGTPLDLRLNRKRYLICVGRPPQLSANAWPAWPDVAELRPFDCGRAQAGCGGVRQETESIDINDRANNQHGSATPRHQMRAPPSKLLAR
ncbi:hypothetical protein FH972_024582 [Carpinus fangiana]|uniref:Uncharacterized protein n=1 Tax=Carpinus fangiana TaxID=176857 RepID=A0A5N6KYE6_9ROSI|nr:hypothetical protein FH972_024582 [Carpinus fangiana]